MDLISQCNLKKERNETAETLKKMQYVLSTLYLLLLDYKIRDLIINCDKATEWLYFSSLPKTSVLLQSLYSIPLWTSQKRAKTNLNHLCEHRLSSIGDWETARNPQQNSQVESFLTSSKCLVFSRVLTKPNYFSLYSFCITSYWSYKIGQSDTLMKECRDCWGLTFLSVQWFTSNR